MQRRATCLWLPLHLLLLSWPAPSSALNPLLYRPDLMRELSESLQPELTVVVLPDINVDLDDELQVTTRYNALLYYIVWLLIFSKTERNII